MAENTGAAKESSAHRTLGSTLQLEKPSWEQCSYHSSVQLRCGDRSLVGALWTEGWGRKTEKSKVATEVLWVKISPSAECTLFSHLSQPVFASSWTIVLPETTWTASLCLQTSRLLSGNGLPADSEPPGQQWCSVEAGRLGRGEWVHRQI